MGLSSVDRIPGIMKANGWLQGSVLLGSWFSRPAAVMPKYDSPDISTIKISWVLKFSRASFVFNNMIRDKVWTNSSAVTQLMKPSLRNKIINCCFDFSGLKAADLHPLHVNFRPVTSPAFPLDGLTAALGNFAIYVIPIAGETSLKNGRLTMSIDRIGFQVMDSFDFNGFQFLGCWDEATNRVSEFPINGTKMIFNKDFRDWRDRNRRGGDYLIYSDLKIVDRVPPDVFILPA